MRGTGRLPPRFFQDGFVPEEEGADGPSAGSGIDRPSWRLGRFLECTRPQNILPAVAPGRRIPGEHEATGMACDVLDTLRKVCHFSSLGSAAIRASSRPKASGRLATEYIRFRQATRPLASNFPR